MKPADSLPLGGISEEVSALIVTLHDAQQRLEVLTEGEIDTVADRDGRTFLLRRAQEHLRASEAAKQASILNALPAYIALLDARGSIVSVNDAWRQFPAAEPIQRPGYSIGLNYPEICDSAWGEGAADGRRIAEGMRSVLTGVALSFATEYSSHTPTQQCWFLLTVTPLDAGGPNGVVVMHLDITERKRAEDEQLAARSKLAESELHLRTIFDTEPECVKVVSKDMVVLDMNAAGLAMMDAGSLAEMQARPLIEFIVPEHRAAFTDLHARVMRGESGIATYQVVGLKGGRRWLETHAAPMAGGNGKAAMMLGITRDITVRREADEQIKRGSEELRRFSSAMDATADAIYLVDRSTMRFVHVNEAACRMQGRTRDEMAALGPAGVLSVPREELERTYDSIIASGVDAEPVEMLRQRQNGTEAWVELRRHALHSEAGWTIVTLVRDVTERKQAQQSILQEKDFISAMLDSLPGLFYLIDSQGRFIRWNKEFESVSGYSSEEVARLNPTNLFTGPEKQLVADAIGQVFVSGNADIEAGFTAKDRTSTPYLLTGRRVQFAQAPHLIGMGIDITSRKEADAKIIRLNRVYALLSGINGTIVRIRERGALFSEVCRIAVADGGFTFARAVELDSHGTARIPASTEPDSRMFTKIVDEYNADPARSQNMLAVALRSGQPMISNDVANDPRMPNRAALTLNGTFAVAVLPVIVEQRVAGAVVLRAREAGMFDEVELRLLLEVVANLSFALEHIEKEAKVRRLTRVYAVLSGINMLIVRVRTREELFREACRIAIEAGEFKMAWIGIIDQQTLDGKVVAWHGVQESFLDIVKLTAREDTPYSDRPGCRALRLMQPVICNDFATDPSVQPIREQLLQRGHKSAGCFPLTVAGRREGVLCLFAGETGVFNEAETRLLAELAGDISLALEHIEKAQKLERVTRMNSLLSGINGAIVRIRDRQQLFEEACRIAVETGSLPFAWLGVVDASETQLELVASAGRDGGFLQTIRDRLAMRGDTPDTESLSWRAIRERRAVVVNDVAADSVLRSRKAFSERGIKSVAVFPLVIAGRTVGAFALHSEQAGFFDDDEMRLLDEMAANIAFAMEHIEKEEKVRRLTRVYAVLSGITALTVHVRDRQELFNEACRIAVSEGGFLLARVIDVDSAGKARIATSTETDTSRYQRMVDEYNEDPEHSRSLLRLALRDQRPLFSNDVATDARIPSRAALAKDGSYALALLPLLAGQRLVGTLILRGPVGAFNDDENRLLLEMTANISVAIERIDQEERIERMTRVNAILSGINAAIVRIRDRQELFEEACRIAVEAGGLPFAWMSVVDVKGLQLRPVASSGAGGDLLELMHGRLSLRDDAPGGYGLSARSVREKRACVANDIETSEDVRQKSMYAARGVKAIAALPLMVGNQPIGVLVLHSAETGFFDADEMRLLGEVAANIAFALEHMEQEDKVLRLTRVHAVLSGINGLIVRVRDRDELFRESCRIAVDAGALAKAWIGTIDPASGQFSMVASHGGDPLFFRALEEELVKKVLAGEGLVARAVSTLQPVVTNDAANDPEVLLKDDLRGSGVRSAAVLPLVVSGAAIGVLVLNSDIQGFFDDEEMALLAELARNIAFAVDHIGKQERLDHFAYYDELTGLANRTLFLERLAQHMRSAVSSGHKLALFYIDVERFRNINDSLGRPAGDAILKQMTEWLIRNVGDASLLARLGSDHFAIVLPQVKLEGEVAHLLDKRMRALDGHQFRVGDTEFRITIRVGVALFPNDGTDATTLVRNAEAALKNAKLRGDRMMFYTQKMTDAVAGKLTLETQLRRALDSEEFVLHFQPKVSLESGKLTSAEALIRWNDPKTGLVPPGKFIPILEETGLIYDVGRWALRKAIGEYLRWRAAGLPAVRIAVNVSPLQLRNRGFIAEVQQVIGVDPLAAAGLELEITESVIMEDVKNSIAMLQAIRETGVTIAIDDFGTGFSSLSQLARLPVDALKIDRSFIAEMTSESKGLSLVSTIISLAHALRLKVVAEGVETEEQSRILRLLRCDEMQGFLFSKPVPAEVFEARFLASPQVA